MAKFMFWSLASMVMLINMLFVIPVFEGAVFPVVDNMYYTGLLERDNEVFVRIIGEKLRACELVSYAAYAGEPLREGAIFFMEDAIMNTVPNSKPVGYHDFGEWKIIPALQGELKFVFQHRCHPMWLTETIITPRSGVPLLAAP